MRTLIYCTSFFQDTPGSAERWRRWIAYYRPRLAEFGADGLLLIDDGSPLENIPGELPLVHAGRFLPRQMPSGSPLFRFDSHLGRNHVFRFPGWWRSFSFAAVIARKYGYRKLIHIESDAFVLSNRMSAFLRDTALGWTAFWCPRYNRPESAIQVICADQFEALEGYYHRGPDFWQSWICAETALPFTSVDRTFHGDRFGEFLPAIPQSADFVCQTTGEMAASLVSPESLFALEEETAC
ncbi:MAG: hypothetical protein JNL98_04845 [Bryobacterales bacterium]|nr:hypothetical protein [Bryobacterales bacterium]